MRGDLHLEQAKRWRSRADACRALGEHTHDQAAKASFACMAETYDRLANGLEERAATLWVQQSDTG